MKKPSQRAFMRELVERYGVNEERVVLEYAKAERSGAVERYSNSYDSTPEQYAQALWHDAVRKGWISGVR